MSNYDVIIVGAGFAGATVAQQCAEKGQKVLVIEKRKHIGGNSLFLILIIKRFLNILKDLGTSILMNIGSWAIFKIGLYPFLLI